MVLLIGAGCPTSIALGSCKMRFVSGPFDWTRVPDMGTVVELLAQRMEGFMDYDDLMKEDENAPYLIVRISFRPPFDMNKSKGGRKLIWNW